MSAGFGSGETADNLRAAEPVPGRRTDSLLATARPLRPRPAAEPKTVSPDPWEPPLPLDRGAELPAFPVGGLPGWLRSFVVAEAEATQTPPDMAAMFGLAAIATVVSGHVQIEPIPGWVEGLNLFIAVAMEPGSRKSAVHRDLMSPIVAYEKLLVESARPDIAEKASIRRIAEAALAKAEKAAATAKDQADRSAREEEARRLSAALDRLDVPASPRLFTADVTPEKLASLLHENGGRIAVLSAEGGIFDIMAGRYSSGVPNIDVYLAGHAGDPIRVDRRGRPTEFVDRPALTIGLAVQPFVLAKAARVGDFAGRGLLDRFLYALPAGTVGYRRADAAPMPEPIRALYDTSLRALAASFDRLAGPVTLHLSPEASALFSTWRAEIEPRRRPEADLGPIAGWSAKLDGAVARIAGLLHVGETFLSGPEAPISAATMAAALDIGAYLIAHALAAFDLMGADPRLEAARRIGRWIVSTRRATFTKREAFRALRGQALFPTVEAIGAGLAALEEHDWVRPVVAERVNGRPSCRYETNPAVLGGAWTKRPEPTLGPSQEGVLSILAMDSEPADLRDWYVGPLPVQDEDGLGDWGTIS